jgi:UDP-3-O-[3-hydroxymyristoyl] glucosamine N-acyltransferase LpxD
MRYKRNILTPATKGNAGPLNYTWYNGKGRYPQGAGYVFTAKDGFADQIYKDLPDGIELFVVGEPAWVGEGTVIGGPGFGWYGNPPRRFPHIGGVIFGSNVEIGANSTIDRGAIDMTVIDNDVKIDNGVHIGHNAIIGCRSLLTAHCNIGGSVEIGEDCWIGLGAQIKNQVRIGAGVTVGMGAVVLRDVPHGKTVVGNPAKVLE